jgi:hypothetical protein
MGARQQHQTVVLAKSLPIVVARSACDEETDYESLAAPQPRVTA